MAGKYIVLRQNAVLTTAAGPVVHIMPRGRSSEAIITVSTSNEVGDMTLDMVVANSDSFGVPYNLMAGLAAPITANGYYRYSFGVGTAWSGLVTEAFDPKLARYFTVTLTPTVGTSFNVAVGITFF